MADPTPPLSDRRAFLGQASSILAGGLLAASSSSADGQIAPSEVEPVSVAVVGTGGRGCDLIRALTTVDGVRVTDVCDTYGPHLERGWQYAGPLCRTHGDYRSLLQETKAQAVVVAVPLDRHFEVARAAVESGRSVFCEKMMCYSVEQARELASLVDANGTVFQVGLQRRANAIYKQAAAMVQTGMLGQVTAVKCQWHRHNDWRRPVPVPADHPDYPGLESSLNWRLYHAHSRGLLAELASHQLDVVNWFLGRPPTRVLATGGVDYWRDGREAWDNVFCVYEYELPPPPAPRRGPAPELPVTTVPYTVRVTYTSLQTNAFEGASELIEGTKGTLFLSQKKGLLYRELTPTEIEWSRQADKNAAVVATGKTLKLSNDPWAHRGAPFEIDSDADDTREELVQFIDHVRRGDPLTICPAKVGVENVETIMMAYEAIRTSRPVKRSEIG